MSAFCSGWDRCCSASEAFLTVSGQLNIEAYCLALTKVYTFAPTFHAEDSNTKHLAEFWTASAEALSKYTFAALLKEREEDLAFFDQRVEKGLVAKLEGIVGSEFVHMDYGEAIQVVERSDEKFEFPVNCGTDPCSRSTSAISLRNMRRSRPS